MNARLTPEREGEIAARVEAAHPGPWRRSDDEGSLERYVLSEDDLMAISFGYRGNNTQAEANFVAHAREDVPALLAELAAVRAERDALQERLHNAAMTRTWRNEDGKKFVFVEDIAPALLGLASTHTTPEEAS